MTTITDAVREVIKRNPIYTSAILAGIADYTKIAKAIKEDVEKILKSKSKNIKGVKEKSLVTIVQRVASEIKEEKSEFYEKIENVLKKAKATITTNVVEFNLVNDWRILKATYEFASQKNFHPEAVISIVQGLKEIAVIVGEDFAEEYEKHIEKIVKEIEKEGKVKKAIRTVNKDIVLLDLIGHEDSLGTPGYFQYILTLLAERKINIVDMLTSYTETIILLNRHDAPSAYDAIDSKIREIKEKNNLKERSIY